MEILMVVVTAATAAAMVREQTLPNAILPQKTNPNNSFLQEAMADMGATAPMGATVQGMAPTAPTVATTGLACRNVGPMVR